MKKALSMLLSLLMLVSMFSITFVQASAAEVQEYFTVTSSGFSNNEITYYVSLNPNQTKLNSIILNFSYDSNILSVVEDKSGAVGENNNFGEFNPNVDGLYEKGDNRSSGKYVVAFFNPNGVTVGASSVAFVKVTFEVISENRPLTDVTFECVEFISDDGDASNDKTKATDPVIFDEDTFLTLNAVKNKEVLSNAEGLKFVWEPVKGAEWYKVYRKAVDETEWTEMVTDQPITETNYVDKITGDDLGKVFEYVAEPWNSYGNVPHSDEGVKGKYFGTIDYIDAVMTETGAEVTWTVLDGADSYSLYQMAEGDEDWSFVKTVTTTTCHSRALESGKKYFFTVKAHSEGYLAETSAEPEEIVFLGAPDDVYAAISDEAITLTWNGVNGAESYNVYKKNVDAEELELLENITDGVDGVFEFVDSDVVNGKTYEYVIQSVNAVTESVIGTEYTTVKKLPVTKNVTVELGKNGLLVKWDEADFADGYKVFKKEIGTTNWVAVGSSETTQYLDTRVSTGKTYSYKVATLGDGGIYEAENSEASNEIIFVALPVINSAVAYGDKITISWKKIVGAELYDVYKYNAENEEWELVDTVDVNTYDDYDVIGGETYGYSVVAIACDETSLFDEEGVWVKYLSAPTGLVAENSYDGVALSWNEVAGADEYVIYHKVGSGTYKEIASFDATQTTYVHTGATAGQDNYYNVYARGGLTYSEASEVSIRYLSAPVIASVAVSNRNSILVSWAKIDGADGYNVYRKACNATEWELIGTTASSRNSYLDSDVFYTNDYTYTVQACYGDSYSAFDDEGTSFSLQATAEPSLRLVNNSWRCVVGAKYDYSYKGLVYYNGTYYYVANGYLDWEYNGFVPLNNEYYYVSNGMLDLYGDSLAFVDGEWCYVKGGKLDPTGNTLVNFNGGWYYVVNGKLAEDYTGLVSYGGCWYYVVNGCVDFNQTTLVYQWDTWFYVENGVLKWDSDTLVNYNGGWYYAKNGVVAWDYTGLASYAGNWYYVVGGVLDWTQTTITYYNGTWYYVENGVLNWYCDTLVNYYGDWYYVRGGVVDWGYTGLVNYAGGWYYVVGGYLDWSQTTITYYNGTWYYVENGVLNWYCDTLVNYYGDWYYVRNGMVAWDYTGYVNYGGGRFYITGGYLDWSKQ